MTARWTRRDALTAAGSGLAGIGFGASAVAARGPGNEGSPKAETVPFFGHHQGGVSTAPQQHLVFGAFDLDDAGPSALSGLLRDWTELGASLTSGSPASGPGAPDPAENRDLSPGRLTLTFGFGPGIFSRASGLAARKPPGLVAMPAFTNDDIDPARSGGDLCVQACADTPQAAFHGLHTLARAASDTASLRWTQAGFRADLATVQPPRQRNLFGFKDGTNNLHFDDARALRQHVWVGAEGPAWLRGGTYVVVRRIRMLFDVWDTTPVDEQERVFGRRKATGAPLGGFHETDPVALRPRSGISPIPNDAHIRVAAPDSNDGARLLRRSYSFNDGTLPDARTLDAGLFFICFQRDPRTHFLKIQRRLSRSDALTRHTIHTASAVFACPPGALRHGFIGQGLFS